MVSVSDGLFVSDNSFSFVVLGVRFEGDDPVDFSDVGTTIGGRVVGVTALNC